MPVIALFLIAVAVGADQYIKLLALEHLKPVGTIDLIPGFLNLIYVENKGAAFGILENHRWLLIAATVIVSLVILFLLFAYKNHKPLSYIASILIVAGGIGNLIDRIFRGFVVDYIHLSFFPPVFNFADCCVTVGTVLLIIHVIFYMESDSKHGLEKVIRRK